MRKQALSAIVPLLCLFILASCGPSGGIKTAKIVDVGWNIDNLPTSYNCSCFYNFWIYFNGDINIADVKTARVILPDGLSWWTMDLASHPSYFSAANSRIGGTTRFHWSSTGHALPIGIMTASLELTNGTTSTYKFKVGVPGYADTNGYDYVYTEDIGSPMPISTAVSAQALKRAIVSSATLNTTTSSLNIGFSTDDNRTFNGYVWFYDASDNYLGVSKRFVDGDSGVKLLGLNTGAGLITTGASNTLILAPADVRDSNGTALSTSVFNSIATFELVTLDGDQYDEPGDYWDYDYRAISSPFAVTVSP